MLWDLIFSSFNYHLLEIPGGGLLNVPLVAVSVPPHPLLLATYVISKPPRLMEESLFTCISMVLVLDTIGSGITAPQCLPIELDNEPSNT